MAPRLLFFSLATLLGHTKAAICGNYNETVCTGMNDGGCDCAWNGTAGTCDRTKQCGGVGITGITSVTNPVDMSLLPPCTMQEMRGMASLTPQQVQLGIRSGSITCNPMNGDRNGTMNGTDTPTFRNCNPEEMRKIVPTFKSEPSEEMIMGMLMNGTIPCRPGQASMPKLPDCTPGQMLKFLKDNGNKFPAGMDMVMMQLNGSLPCSFGEKTYALPPCTPAQTSKMTMDMMMGKGPLSTLMGGMTGGNAMGSGSIVGGVLGSMVGGMVSGMASGTTSAVAAGGGTTRDMKNASIGAAISGLANMNGAKTKDMPVSQGSGTREGNMGNGQAGEGDDDMTSLVMYLEVIASGELTCQLGGGGNMTGSHMTGGGNRTGGGGMMDSMMGGSMDAMGNAMTMLMGMVTMMMGMVGGGNMPGGGNMSGMPGMGGGNMSKPEAECSVQELLKMATKSPAEMVKMMNSGTLGCKLSLKALTSSKAYLPGVGDLTKLPPCTTKQLKEMGQKESDLLTMALGGKLKCLPEELVEAVVAEKPSKEAKDKVGQLLAGCKDASCLQDAAQALKDAGGLSEKAQKTFLNQLAGEAAKNAAKEGVKDCFAKDKTDAQKKECLASAPQKLVEATEALLGNRSDAVKAKVQEQLLQEAKRDALGDSFSTCLQGGGNKSSCLAQVAGDLAAAGLEGEDPRNIRDNLMRKKLQEAAADCSDATCRKAAKAAAVAAGMEPREYAAIKAIGDIKAAAEIYANCKLAGTEEDECVGMARADWVTKSGASASAFSEELQARIKKLGAAIIAGVPVKMVRLKRLVATVLAIASSCDDSLSLWFASQCLDRAKAKQSKAEGAKAKDCIMVDSKVQYSASVNVDASDDDIDAASAHIASSFEDQTLGAASAARRLDTAARRLAAVDETYASQDVAECSEEDQACLKGEPSTETETAAAPSPSGATSAPTADPTAAPTQDTTPATTPAPTPAPPTSAPGSEPVAAASGCGLGLLAALAAAVGLWQ